MFLVYRTKDNTDVPSKDLDRRTVFVIENTEHFNQTLDYLYPRLKDGGRIYASLDERRFDKAMLEFRKSQTEADESERNRYVFYMALNKAWHKALMQNRSRKSKLFLWDADSQGELAQLHREFAANNVNIDYMYDSKDGYHVVTQPFNPAVLSDNLQPMLHRNAMMLWAWK